VRNSNLILWGDPGSNAVLKRLLADVTQASSLTRQPGFQPGGAAGGQDARRTGQAGSLSSVLQWTREKLTVAGQTYDATQHAPILIYPNPANPARYIVINSGPTFREEALGTADLIEARGSMGSARALACGGRRPRRALPQGADHRRGRR